MAKATSKSSAKSKKPAPTKAKKAAAPAPKKVVVAKAEKSAKADKPAAKASAPKELEKKIAPAAAAPIVKQNTVGKAPAEKMSTKPAPAAAKAAAADDDDEENDSSRSNDHDDDNDDGDERHPVRPAMSTADAFSPEDLEMFRQLLSEERKKLIHKARIAMESGNIALNKDEMMDEVDLASATVEQNLTFRLLDRDRKLLGEIEHAIGKLDNGEYGFCEGTGELIPKRRLELRPWTRHSVKYKEQLERMKKSGRGVADEDEAW